MKAISRSELESKYRSMKNKDLASLLGISVPTLLKIIDENKIERKGSGNTWPKHNIVVTE